MLYVSLWPKRKISAGRKKKKKLNQVKRIFTLSCSVFALRVDRIFVLCDYRNEKTAEKNARRKKEIGMK
jgi:hypothetical protein